MIWQSKKTNKKSQETALSAQQMMDTLSVVPSLSCMVFSCSSHNRHKIGPETLIDRLLLSGNPVLTNVTRFKKKKKNFYENFKLPL